MAVTMRSVAASYIATQRSARPSAVSTNTRSPARAQPTCAATKRINCSRYCALSISPRSRRPEMTCNSDWTDMPDYETRAGTDQFTTVMSAWSAGRPPEAARWPGTRRTSVKRHTARTAAMQDEPVVCVDEVLGGHALEQFQLDRQRRPAGRQTGAVADPEDVRVHRTGGLAEGHVEHHIGGLAAHARQRFERFAGARHLATVLLDQDGAGCEQVLRLGAKQADAADVLGERGQPEREHSLG